MDFDKENLLGFYKEIKEKSSARDKLSKQIQILDSEIEISVLKYRINSVKRVLEYVDGSCKDIDCLLTHCINKLNGNLDGIELELKEKKNDKW